MFFWMIVFYFFYIYCANKQGHLIPRWHRGFKFKKGSNSNGAHYYSSVIFNHLEPDAKNKNALYNHMCDPAYKDLPGNTFHEKDLFGKD